MKLTRKHARNLSARRKKLRQNRRNVDPHQRLLLRMFHQLRPSPCRLLHWLRFLRHLQPPLHSLRFVLQGLHLWCPGRLPLLRRLLNRRYRRQLRRPLPLLRPHRLQNLQRQ